MKQAKLLRMRKKMYYIMRTAKLYFTLLYWLVLGCCLNKTIYAQNVITSSQPLNAAGDTVVTQPIVLADTAQIAPKADSTRQKSTKELKKALRWSLLPGGGQIYNRQYWKAPIMAGTFAACLGMNIKRRIDYSHYNDQFEAEVALIAAGTPTLSDADLTILRQNRQNAQRDYNRLTMANIYIYGINLIDAYASAHAHQNPNIHSPVKAAYYSTMLPGLGQLYNKSYWKIPVVYAGFGVAGYFMYVNQSGMQRYTQEYLARTEVGYGDSDPELAIYSDDTLLKIRGLYKRYYEISIIGASLWYLLNILDATTDAYLHDFDISDDLSWHVQPYFEQLPNRTTYATHSGITWVWNF